MSKTKINITKFAGKPLLQIKEFDKEGNEIEKSVIQFGVKKAEAILLHIEDIKKFIEENKK